LPHNSQPASRFTLYLNSPRTHYVVGIGVLYILLFVFF